MCTKENFYACNSYITVNQRNFKEHRQKSKAIKCVSILKPPPESQSLRENQTTHQEQLCCFAYCFHVHVCEAYSLHSKAKRERLLRT